MGVTWIHIWGDHRSVGSTEAFLKGNERRVNDVHSEWVGASGISIEDMTDRRSDRIASHPLPQTSRLL